MMGYEKPVDEWKSRAIRTIWPGRNRTVLAASLEWGAAMFGECTEKTFRARARGQALLYKRA